MLSIDTNNIARVAGHITQLVHTGTDPTIESESTVNETMTGTNQTTLMTWNQTLSYGLKRSTSVNDTLQQSGIIAASYENTSSLATSLSNPNNITSTNRTLLSGSDGGKNMADVDIAVLDTGISLNHPDLNVYRNVSFVNGTLTGDDDQGHGSHVAGIAAAKDNDIGILGIASGARLWAIKVCDAGGECRILNQIRGIEYAIEHVDEIDVLN